MWPVSHVVQKFHAGGLNPSTTTFLFELVEYYYNSLVKIVKSMIVFIFLGVAQLLNKNNGKPFTEGDENLFEVSYSVHAVINPAETSGRR